MIAWMSEQPRMNKDPEFLAGKRRRVGEPYVEPLNAGIERWRQGGRQVPWADPDSEGMHSKILFCMSLLALPRRPGIAAGSSAPTTTPVGRTVLAVEQAGRAGQAQLHQLEGCPVVCVGHRPSCQRHSSGGQAALPYLRQFVTLLSELLVVVVMGAFAEHWWLHYLCQPESPVLPLITVPPPSVSARRGRPDFEREIAVAMVKARNAAGVRQPCTSEIRSAGRWLRATQGIGAAW
jgi:hypothetical protein